MALERSWWEKTISLIVIVSGVMIILGLPLITVLRFSDAATADKQTESINSQRAQLALTNCARAVVTERNELIDARDNAQARVTQALIATLLVTPENRAPLQESLAALNADLENKIRAVEQLPPYDQEVERQCGPSARADHGGGSG